MTVAREPFHKRRRAGMSLGELLISMVVFMLFSLVIYVVLTMGLRFGERSGSASRLEEAAIRVKETISREFRESFPISQNLRLLKKFGVAFPVLFKPDAASPTSTEIIFTKPCFVTLDTAASSLSLDSASALQTVRFFVEGGDTLVEERTRYNSDGSMAETKKQSILALRNKKITLKADYVGARSLLVTITCRDDRKEISLSFMVITQTK